jgi:hypothetical protein
MDVDINGVIYSVKMADCVYHVSTNNHSEATGALIVAFHTSKCAPTLIKSGRSYHMSS